MKSFKNNQNSSRKSSKRSIGQNNNQLNAGTMSVTGKVELLPTPNYYCCYNPESNSIFVMYPGNIIAILSY